MFVRISKSEHSSTCGFCEEMHCSDLWDGGRKGLLFGREKVGRFNITENVGIPYD